MTNISFNPHSWLIDGRPDFLIGGELQYFRIPRRDWKDRLRAFKEAGGNCVGTYMPWLLHEPQEGRFDFTTYDPVAYFGLCHELGLQVMLRPGPYQYSELIWGGLPGWLVQGYRQIRARRLDGGEIKADAVSYLHPTFLTKVERWFAAWLPLVRPHLATNGGPVALLQIDNEMVGPHEWNGSLDYHPVSMGVGRERGRWRAWLERAHGSLAAANRCYGTRAAAWADLRPMAKPEHGTPPERRLVRDYFRFYLDGIAEYGGILADWMRDGGVDVPLAHNSASPYANAYFAPLVKRLGDGFLLGSDHYYNLDLDWDQDRPAPKYVAKVASSLAQLREMGFPPTVWELPGGSLSDWPAITAHDAECCYLANLAYGMKGFNVYIFAGGRNPPLAGTTSDVYDFSAGLDPLTGARRPLYAAQRRFFQLLERKRWLVGAERVADCRIGLCAEYALSSRYAGDRAGLLFSSQEAFAFARKGFFLTASCAGLSPDFIALEGENELPTDLPLMVASGGSMPEAVQRRLVSFLDAGGRLLLAPVVPWLDEEFRPCRILADRLGASAQSLGTGEMPPRLHACGQECVFVNGGLYPFAKVPRRASREAWEERSKALIGWRRTLPGGGAATVLGFHWRQSHREHERMLLSALSGLGLERRLICDNPNVWAVLRSDGRTSMVFLLNLFTAPATCAVRVRDPVHGTWTDLGRIAVPGGSVVTRTMTGRATTKPKRSARRQQIAGT